MTSSGAGTGAPSTSGYHILTTAEGAAVLRCSATDQNMLDLLPIIDKYIEMATGRDWTEDSPIYDEAKAAARMLLVRWHEDPGGMAAGAALGQGLMACLAQLEAKALILESDGVPVSQLALLDTNISGYMAIGASITLIFNHQMATASTSSAVLQNSAGATVASTNSLDATGKIMTVNPNANLATASGYSVVITDAADIYGQTIETTVTFYTV